MNDLSQESMSWSEVAELTHATQVERFNWCSCEEQKYFPYADCPRECDVCEAKDGEPHCNCGNCDCGKEKKIMDTLPKRINAMKCISYDVQQIVESLMAEQEVEAESVTIEMVMDRIESWVEEDFMNDVADSTIYQDENGGEI